MLVGRRTHSHRWKWQALGQRCPPRHHPGARTFMSEPLAHAQLPHSLRRIVDDDALEQLQRHRDHIM